MKRTIAVLMAAFLAVSFATPALAASPSEDIQKQAQSSKVLSVNSVGDQFTAGGIVYKVTSAAPATVEVEGPADKNTITQANIPETVTSPNDGETYTVSSIFSENTNFGFGAFSNCPNLVSASIPSTISDIGNFTFYACSKLESLSLAEGVRQIGDFSVASAKLVSITIPSTMEKIHEYAFVSCMNLSKVTFLGTTAPTFDGFSFDGIAPGAVAYVPGSSIGSGTGMYHADGYPFSDGYPLKLEAQAYDEFTWDGIVYGITSPTTLIVKGLEDKYSITNAYLDPGSDVYEVTAIEPRAFEGCQLLTSVSIPGTVKDVGSFTFNNCNSLTYLNLGEGVQKIGASFASYTNLGSVSIPSTVTEIGQQAFRYIPSLTAVTFAGTTAPSFGYKSFDDIATNAVAYVPEGRIGTGTGMYHPSSYPFANSTPLKLQDQFTVNGINYKISSSVSSTVTVIGPAQISGFTQANIPETVTSPGGNVFTVTAIASNAFKGCYSLVSASIPGSITNLSDGVFQNCNQLTSLTLGEGIQRIGKNILSNSGNLTSITIPSTVTVIDDSFNNCSALGEFTFLPTTAPQFTGTCFANTAPGGIGYVPAGRLGTDPGMYNGSVYPLANLTLIEMS